MSGRRKKKKLTDYQKFIAQAPKYEGVELPHCTFALVFNCIFMDVVEYTWFLLDNLWAWGNSSWEILSECLLENEIWITDSDMLLRNASSAINDWCTIYGVCNPTSIESFTTEIYKPRTITEQFDFHVNEIDICLFNIDGAYWSVFSKDDRILESLRNRFANSKLTELCEVLWIQGV